MDIPPDEEALIKKAGGDTECDHEFVGDEDHPDDGASIVAHEGTCFCYETRCKH